MTGNKDMKFIFTDDAKSANALVRNGLTLLSHTNGIFFFMNDQKRMLFEEVPNINYTNKLFV